MPQHTYFMHPRVVKNTYLKGWKGHPTMVLGASLPCTLQDCPMKEACMRNSRDFDKACFWYRQFPERDDLCLSNSNVIEVDSFIEGNPAHYFSDFTKFMIGKMDEIPLELRGDFWDSIAFYNYDQNIHFTLNDNDSPDHAHDTEENFTAFMDALEELNPKVIYVWFTQVRDILIKHHVEGLQEIDQLNVNGITVHRFTYKITPTPHPEKVLEDFKKTFAFGTCSGKAVGNATVIDSISKEYAEGYFLHALYRARGYHQTLPYTPLRITEDMIDFAQPYAWDESLYIYLIKGLQEHLGLDVAYQFIHQNWNRWDELCVTANFYCGIPKCIPSLNFTPSELSFFRLTNSEILKTENAAEELNFQFVFLNEDTEKRELASLLYNNRCSLPANNSTTNNLVTNTPTCKIGLFLSTKDCPAYEKTILQTQRVKSIHLLTKKKQDAEQLVYIEMNECAPIETIELYRDREKVADCSFQQIQTRKEGKRLLVRELTEKQLTKPNLTLMKKLCLLGWIKKCQDKNHYSFNISKPIAFPHKKEIRPGITIDKPSIFKGKQINGLVLLYLEYKQNLTREEMINYFPEISNIELLTKQKSRAIKKLKDTGLCDEDYDYSKSVEICGEIIDKFIDQCLRE